MVLIDKIKADTSRTLSVLLYDDENCAVPLCARNYNCDFWIIKSLASDIINTSVWRSRYTICNESYRFVLNLFRNKCESE